MSPTRLIYVLLLTSAPGVHCAEQSPTASGPEVEMVRTMPPAFQIIFKHTGGGLSCSATNVTGFAIAGSDRMFFPADVKIIGETVRLTNTNVPVPVAARYTAPTNSADALLGKNSEPTASFRTDVWPTK